MWSLWRNTAGPAVGHLVRAHALEDARAVVQRVREHVDLGVLVGDELAVHPDLMAHVTAPPAPPWSPRRWSRCRPGRPVRTPFSRARSTADSTAAASSSRPESVAQHQRGGEDHPDRVGDPLAGDVGRRAVDGLEQAGADRRRGWRSAACPSEPVSIDASSERMSPNMFSVTITSKCRGAAISFIAAASTSRCSSSMFGNSSAWMRVTTVAPQPRSCRARWPCRRSSRGYFAASKPARAIRSISSTV